MAKKPELDRTVRNASTIGSVIEPIRGIVVVVPLGQGYPQQDCAIARALEVVGDRWTLLVLRDCYEGSCLMEGGCGETLPAGTYRLVVDGIDGAQGPYTITPLVLPAAPYKRWTACPECANQLFQL